MFGFIADKPDWTVTQSIVKKLLMRQAIHETRELLFINSGWYFYSVERGLSCLFCVPF